MSFEGPLDLLLYLVRKEEVELYDLIPGTAQPAVPRSPRRRAPQPDLDRAGDFIAMAAHLIYLKSRRLLPPEQLPAGADDAGEEIDPRWELIRQLVEYKKFKDVASHLQGGGNLAARSVSCARPGVVAGNRPRRGKALRRAGIGGHWGVRSAQGVSADPAPVRGENGRRRTPSFSRIISPWPTRLRNRLRDLMAQSRGQGLTFTELFARTTSRVEMVVTFLALLELVRLKQLRVEQSAAFEESYDFPASGDPNRFSCRRTEALFYHRPPFHATYFFPLYPMTLPQVLEALIFASPKPLTLSEMRAALKSTAEFTEETAGRRAGPLPRPGRAGLARRAGGWLPAAGPQLRVDRDRRRLAACKPRQRNRPLGTPAFPGKPAGPPERPGAGNARHHRLPPAAAPGGSRGGARSGRGRRRANAA